MHPYRCIVFIFCNLLKYYFFDKGVCFPFPLLLVPKYTSLCNCLCIPIYCYSLAEFFTMKLLDNNYAHWHFWCTLPLANLLLIFCHHCQGSILKFVWLSFSAPTVFLLQATAHETLPEIHYSLLGLLPGLPEWCFLSNSFSWVLSSTLRTLLRTFSTS